MVAIQNAQSRKGKKKDGGKRGESNRCWTDKAKKKKNGRGKKKRD